MNCSFSAVLTLDNVLDLESLPFATIHLEQNSDAGGLARPAAAQTRFNLESSTGTHWTPAQQTYRTISAKELLCLSDDSPFWLVSATGNCRAS
jgi:hypothetical protein